MCSCLAPSQALCQYDLILACWGENPKLQKSKVPHIIIIVLILCVCEAAWDLNWFTGQLTIITAFFVYISFSSRLYCSKQRFPPVQQAAEESRFIPLKWPERKKKTSDPEHLLLSFSIFAASWDVFLQDPVERTDFHSLIWLLKTMFIQIQH